MLYSINHLAKGSMNYWRNIGLAVRGRNPFAAELEQVKKAYEQLAARVKLLDGLNQDAHKEVEVLAVSVSSYQRLVENLRERIAVRENSIKSLNERCQRRLADSDREIDGLRNQLAESEAELERANKQAGRGLMSETLLARTNSALGDLCEAMACADVEKMMSVVEGLEWNNGLSRIAQYYMTVLRRKNELEGRHNKT